MHCSSIHFNYCASILFVYAAAAAVYTSNIHSLRARIHDNNNNNNMPSLPRPHMHSQLPFYSSCSAFFFCFFFAFVNKFSNCSHFLKLNCNVANSNSGNNIKSCKWGNKGVYKHHAVHVVFVCASVQIFKYIRIYFVFQTITSLISTERVLLLFYYLT